MNMKLIRSLRGRLGIVTALVPAVLALWLTSALPLQTPTANAQGEMAPEAKTAIRIDLTQNLGSISPRAFGLTLSNQGHDRSEPMFYYRTAAGQQMLHNLGIKSLNYGVDEDNWASPYDSFSLKPVVFPKAMLTDEFLQLSQKVGAEPIVAVNVTYTCALSDAAKPATKDNVQCQMVTPDLARKWLKYIKSTGIARVQYVQLGVEPYAGCRYWNNPDGMQCVDVTGRHRIALPQEVYAQRVVDWAKALKKVDPTIKVGLQLEPNVQMCQKPCSQTWDEYLLKKVGSTADFVITHQYYYVPSMPQDQSSAQRMSYYQEQSDIRIVKQGITANPTQIRKELAKWLPGKQKMPIVIGEFNVGVVNDDQVASAPDVRMSLYNGIAFGEAALDMLSPIKTGATYLPGAERFLILDLSTPQVMLTQYLPTAPPQTLVVSPIWKVLEALKDFQGKNWVPATITQNLKTPVGRGALRAYAAKKGKKVWVAVFNHSTDKALTLDLQIAGGSPASAMVTRVGDTAASMLTANTSAIPDAIAAQTTALPASQVATDRLRGVVFPPHSLTVIAIRMK